MTGMDLNKQPFSPEDFSLFGMENVAYVKPMLIRGQIFHVVHAADGTPLMVAPERELAFAAVRQQEMEPASVGSPTSRSTGAIEISSTFTEVKCDTTP